jgi:deoxyxylulose-5-phosphate synthase
MIADAISRLDDAVTPPRVRVLGTPKEYIQQAKPDAILAELGLDGAGLAAEARALVTALRA